MKEKVSVIIPTWNAALTIKRAILSALNQTYPPLEILVCDDGSSDNTKEIVESINDPRVRWLAGTHTGGPAIPRNRGANVSKGEWLAFLDSDDEWFEEKLEKQLHIVNKLGCKAASTNARRVVPVKGEIGNVISWEKERISFDDLLKVNQVICSSAIVHRSLWRVILGFPEAYELRSIEDWACWLRVTTQTDFAYVNEALVVYWDDPSKSLRKDSPDFWTQRKLVFNNFLNWATEQKDEALQFYISKVKEQRRNDWRQRLRVVRQDLRDQMQTWWRGKLAMIRSKIKTK
jgi:glycosyltransferase involved in cell wall biosynthesis